MYYLVIYEDFNVAVQADDIDHAEMQVQLDRPELVGMKAQRVKGISQQEYDELKGERIDPMDQAKYKGV